MACDRSVDHVLGSQSTQANADVRGGQLGAERGGRADRARWHRVERASLRGTDDSAKLSSSLEVDESFLRVRGGQLDADLVADIESFVVAHDTPFDRRPKQASVHAFRARA